MPIEAHNRAAALHENAAKYHRKAAASHERGQLQEAIELAVHAHEQSTRAYHSSREALERSRTNCFEAESMDDDLEPPESHCALADRIRAVAAVLHTVQRPSTPSCFIEVLLD